MRTEIPRPASNSQTQNSNDTTNVSTELTASTAENSIVAQEITQFHDVEQPRIALPIAPQETSTISQLDDTTSIINFLQRPVKLDQFELVTGKSEDNVVALNAATFKDPQPFVRKRYNIPGDVLKIGGKLEKANHFQYFKADTHIKIVVNANPFIAGRFYLTYSPYENNVDKSRQQIYNSRAGVTAYPGVELDIQIDNSVEMVIPFASYKEAYNLGAKVPEDFVTVTLFAITPMLAKASSGAKIDMTIYAWFENISIIMPTCKSIPFLPQTQTIKEVVKYQDRVVKVDDYQQKLEAIRYKNPRGYKYIMDMLNLAERQVEMQGYKGEKGDVCGIYNQEFMTRLCLLEAEPLEYYMADFNLTYEQFKTAFCKDDRNQAILRLCDLTSLISKMTYEVMHFPEKITAHLKPEERIVKLQIQAEANKPPMQQGIIGDIAAGVGKVAREAGKSLGGFLPIIGEVGSTVGWVSDIVRGVANIFGWSRPNDMERLITVGNVPGKNYSHYSAIDSSVVLGLSAQNELDSMQHVFPSANDEMDINYVCGNPGIKEVISWTTTDPVNKTLGLLEVGIPTFNRYNSPEGLVTCNSEEYVYDLNPPDREYYKPTTTCELPNNGDKVQMVGSLAPTIVDTVPCEYVAQLFQYWRATICFKISVVKTAFHTGRLEIFFDPGEYYSTNGQPARPWHHQVDLAHYDNIDTTNNYKYILDLTQDTEVTIKIPFVSDKLMLSTLGAVNYSSQSGSVAPPQLSKIFDSMIGSLVIRPVNRLLAPETVSDEVKIVVWKWAEDVDFSVPKENTQTVLVPYEFEDTPGTQCVPYKFNSKESEDIQRWVGWGYLWNQGGPDFCQPGEYKEIRGYDNGDGGLLPIPSPVRSVIMQINLSNKADGNVIDIFQGNNSGVSGMAVLANVAGEKLVNLRPLLRCFRTIEQDTQLTEQGITLNFQDSAKNKDYVSILSYLYRFTRGGVRYKLFSNALDTQARITSSLVKDEHKFNNFITGPTHSTYSNINPVHEIMVPFYTQYRKLPISHSENMLKVQVKANKNIKHDILRSGNDDLTFGWLMGSPQLYLGSGQTWQGWKKV